MNNIIFVLLIITYIFIFPAAIFADHADIDDSKCLTLNASLRSDGNWPGGSVKLFCKGLPIYFDGSPGFCPGEEKEVSPGESAILHGCNCWRGGECLEIDKNSIPEGCDVNINGPYCGANGDVLNPEVVLSCEAQQGGIESPISSPAGEAQQPSQPGGSVPIGSTPPSSIPPSSTSPSIPPSSNPPSSSFPPQTSLPKPSPSPVFSPAMCKCDGIESTLIFPGEPTTVTSYAKVEGSDLSAAQVKDQTFYLAKNSTVIAKSEPIAATVIDQSSGKIRYKSTWQFTLPADVDKSAIYRVWSQQRCVKRSSNVLGLTAYAQDGTTNNKSFMDSIISFFGNLFGSTENPPNVNVPSTPEQNATPNVPTTNFDSSGKDKLQLQPLYPATIIKQSKDQSCRFLMFKFN